MREPSAPRDAAHPGHTGWVYFITKQVYEANPSLGLQCNGPMKVIAVIERPVVVRQILEHLGLPAASPSLRAPPDLAGGQAADQPREWSSEPLFDDLPLPDPAIA